MSPPGPLIDPSVVDDAMTATLQRWVPQYVADLGRLDAARRGADGLTADAIQMPQSWKTTADPIENDGVKWPEDQIPAVFVVSEGITDDPRRDGDGRYTATFRIEVGVVVADIDQDSTNRLAKLYFMAVVAAVMKHPSLDGVADGVTWRGGGWGKVPPVQSRTLAGCGAIFDVTVPDVLDVFDTLDEPRPGNPPKAAIDRGVFESHDIQINPDEPEEADQ